MRFIFKEAFHCPNVLSFSPNVPGFSVTRIFFSTFLRLLGSHVTKKPSFSSHGSHDGSMGGGCFCVPNLPNKNKAIHVGKHIYIYYIYIYYIYYIYIYIYFFYIYIYIPYQSHGSSLVICVIIWGRLGQPKEDVSHDSWGPHPTPHGSTKVQCRCTRDAPPFQTTGGVPGGVE